MTLKSNHPNKSEFSHVNERNHGFIGMCQRRKGDFLTWSMGALTNSQTGSTALFGPGLRLQGFEYGRLSFHYGIELPVVAYERRTMNNVRDSRSLGYVVGILPMPYIEPTYRLPHELGTIGYRRSWLSDTRITVDSLVWKIERNIF